MGACLLLSNSINKRFWCLGMWDMRKWSLLLPLEGKFPFPGAQGLGFQSNDFTREPVWRSKRKRNSWGTLGTGSATGSGPVLEFSWAWKYKQSKGRRWLWPWDRQPAATGKSLCVSESTCICRSLPAASSQHASVAQCKCETRNKFYDVFDGCLSVRVSGCPNVSLSYWLPDSESEKQNPDSALELFPFPFPFPGPALTSAVAWDQTLREIAASFILPSILRPGWLPSYPALLPARAVSNANKTFAPAIKAQDDDSLPSSRPRFLVFVPSGKNWKKKNERKGKENEPLWVWWVAPRCSRPLLMAFGVQAYLVAFSVSFSCSLWSRGIQRSRLILRTHNLSLSPSKNSQQWRPAKATLLRRQRRAFLPPASVPIRQVSESTFFS